MLTRLRRCAGWSAPLLFANLEDRFSCAEAQLLSCSDPSAIFGSDREQNMA